MATNRKATMAKRARELAQKDRAKDREQRRADRRARAAERAASGQVGPPIEALTPGEGGVALDDDDMLDDAAPAEGAADSATE